MYHCRYAASVSKEKFVGCCQDGRGLIPPLYKEIPYRSPQSVYPLFAGSNSFLFESVKGPENIARYSFIGFDPCIILGAKDGIIEIETKSGSSLFHDDPLKKLDELLRNYPHMPVAGLPPFQGGAVGLLSYDFVHYLEKLPKTTLDDLSVPDAHFFIMDRVIAFDHWKRKAWVFVNPGVGRDIGSDPGSIYDEAESLLEAICTRASSVPWEGPDNLRPGASKIEVVRGMKKEEYMDIVIRAKEYIAAGDIFQANLSQRVSAYIGGRNPWTLYRELCAINPSPFAGFIDFGEYCIVSSSPERLVRVRDGKIETRPIAGTRPRGRDSREDGRMRDELLLNEKERAEHIMLIDLERNDIGKVSEYGSVSVDEFMITEDYSHVIHIVSNVRGTLLRNLTCRDVIKAVFPGGTITGVPKVRCMEIIDELEPVRRGPYTGSMGYISFSGAVDLNIIIRTFVIKDGYAYVQAGAGIVADSDPEREYHETLKKAEALIRTLGRLS